MWFPECRNFNVKIVLFLFWQTIPGIEKTNYSTFNSIILSTTFHAKRLFQFNMLLNTQNTNAAATKTSFLLFHNMLLLFRHKRHSSWF
jgi:hypothetical protein